MMRNTQPGAIVPAVLMSMALALAGPVQAPVSYTHLTLPTIYSV